MEEIFKTWKKHPKPWQVAWVQGSCMIDKDGEAISLSTLLDYIESLEHQLHKVIEEQDNR